MKNRRFRHAISDVTSSSSAVGDVDRACHSHPDEYHRIATARRSLVPLALNHPYRVACAESAYDVDARRNDLRELFLVSEMTREMRSTRDGRGGNYESKEAKM